MRHPPLLQSSIQTEHRRRELKCDGLVAHCEKVVRMAVFFRNIQYYGFLLSLGMRCGVYLIKIETIIWTQSQIVGFVRVTVKEYLSQNAE
jgi:hypothetical protein